MGSVTECRCCFKIVDLPTETAKHVDCGKQDVEGR
jgi:hypothetical protein